MNKIIYIIFLLFSSRTYGVIEKNGYFSGRVSKINKKAGLVRIHIKFKNQKYLNQRDQVEFWDERSDRAKCEGTLLAKSNDYYLFQVKFIDRCIQNVMLSNGALLRFFSQDLVNNLIMGSEVTSILKKKYQVYFGKVTRKKRQMDAYLSQMDLINKRYSILREKLNKELREELDRIETDRMNTMTELKQNKYILYEIQKKIEQYSMNDDNFNEDRWSLDPKLYIKK